MEVLFKYKGIVYSTPNLEKKLKRMRLNLDDVEIVEKEEKKEEIKESDYIDSPIYTFFNEKDKTTIKSIYPDLNNLRETINVNEYVRIND